MQDGRAPENRIAARIIRNGDQIGIELPAELIARMGLKEGDFVDISMTNGSLPLVLNKVSVDDLFERIKAMRGLVPKGYRFKRDDAYDVD